MTPGRQGHPPTLPPAYEAARPPHPGFGLRRSVFWKVAGILVGVQVTTGLLAVALSAWFAYDHSLGLAENSLRLRLDGVAEEVEGIGTDVAELGLSNLPYRAQLDLSERFPDPVYLLDVDGTPVLKLMPRTPADPPGTTAVRPPDRLPIQADLAGLLAAGDIAVQMDAGAVGGTWGVAPLYDLVSGNLLGGLLVAPLDGSIDRELADTRLAFVEAMLVVVALAVLIAVLLGAFFTWRLVRPLRRITRRVEGIGAGDFGARITLESDDEIGRLGAAINHMAAAVQESIDALRMTDQLRRELVANVGHDLRTPLAALLGYLEEGERFLGAGNYHAATEALTTARQQGHYLRQLVGDLFELSLLDSTRPPLRREPIPLAELIHDAASTQQALFAKAGIQLEVDLERPLPTLQGDGVRLLRVLDNLLSNARRYTPPGGTVQLRAGRHDDGGVTVAVVDNGQGMQPSEVGNIFERYYRGDDARTRKMQGTGLGLPISRAIARAHGGELTVASTPGVGSTFTLYLPPGPA